jgi:hypothetical protein
MRTVDNPLGIYTFDVPEDITIFEYVRFFEVETYTFEVDAAKHEPNNELDDIKLFHKYSLIYGIEVPTIFGEKYDASYLGDV